MSGLVVPEPTYTLNQIAHPEFIFGRAVWCEGGTPGQIADKLQWGDPAKGWEGDPRLVLCFSNDLDRWEVWRLEFDGKYRLTMAKPPGSPLDDSVIDMLVQRDRNRGYNLHVSVEAHNDRLQRAKDAEAERYHNEELVPRLGFELKREGFID